MTFLFQKYNARVCLKLVVRKILILKNNLTIKKIMNDIVKHHLIMLFFFERSIINSLNNINLCFCGSSFKCCHFLFLSIFCFPSCFLLYSLVAMSWYDLTMWTAKNDYNILDQKQPFIGSFVYLYLKKKTLFIYIKIWIHFDINCKFA